MSLSEVEKSAIVSPPPFTGREEERHFLEKSFQKVRAQGSALVLLVGEAGMGKSHLAAEFGNWCRCSGALYLEGRAVAQQGVYPYGPFLELVRGLVGCAANDAEGQYRQRMEICLRRAGIEAGVVRALVEEYLGDALSNGYRESEELRKHLLFEGTRRLIEAQACQRPLCLLLDDLQWAGNAVFELLDYLLANLRHAPVLFLGAYRPEEIRGGRAGAAHPLMAREKTWEDLGVSCLELGRLSAAEVEEMAQREEGGNTGKLGDALYRETEGVPLFAVEYLKLYRQNGHCFADALPVRVSRLIHYRLDRLAPEDRKLLQGAALLGEHFSAALLARVVGEKSLPLLLRLDQLHQSHQLVFPRDEDTYRFTHAKIREVLAGEVPAAARRIYHRAAAEALEASGADGERVFELAYHYGESGVVDRAALYSVRGARRALEQHAGEEALKHARTAVALLDGLDDVDAELGCEVWQTAAQVINQVSGDRVQAAALVHRALAVCRTAVGRADLHCLLSDLSPIGGPVYNGHLQDARRAVGKRTTTVQMARILYRRARVFAQDFRAALPAHLKALEAFEKVAPDDVEIFEVYRQILSVLSRLDERQRLEHYVERFGNWTAGRGDLIASLQMQSVLVETYEALGDYTQVVEAATQVLRLADQLQHEGLQWHQHQRLARALGVLGQFDLAERHWEHLADRLTFVGMVEWARSASRAGRHQQAVQLLERALDRELRTHHSTEEVLNQYATDLDHIEWIFARAGRRGEFADYCGRLQRAERNRGTEIRGGWRGAEAHVAVADWEEDGTSNRAPFTEETWQWQDPYGESSFGVEQSQLWIRATGIVGFNALTMPRLMQQQTGDFAFEIEVQSTEEVQAGQEEHLARIRRDQTQRQHPVPGASGILVHNGRGDAVRLLAHVQCPGGVLFDVRSNGRSAVGGRARVDSGPIVLRLERRADHFSAYCKTRDGHWSSCGAAEVPLEWRVFAGVLAEIPEPFYYLARRGESRFGAIRFYRPIDRLDQKIEEETPMLEEIRRVIERRVDRGRDMDGELLRAVGQGVEADWGRLLYKSGTGEWKVAGEWGDAGNGSSGAEMFEPTDTPELSADGRVVCVPTMAGDSISRTWIWGRQRPFRRETVAHLEHAGAIAAALLEKQRLEKEVEDRQVEPFEGEQVPVFSHIVGRSSAMERVFRDIERIAQGSAPVLVQGESGTGKELVARALHDRGPRHRALFVAQNCAALPEALLESELFGHCKGSFTGATQDKAGLFEAAAGGTIFLDEIADASPAVQAKLLRAVEEGEIRRVGENHPRKVDVRIISATSRDLAEQVERGRVREDLYYRLNVVRLALPPLRQRTGDIPLLAEFFLRKICARDHCDIPGFTRGALNQLCVYAWPGNVRELQNEIERCVSLNEPGQPIGAEVLSASVRSEEAENGAVQERSLQDRMAEFECATIREALERHGGKVVATARELGLSRQWLRQKMRRYNLAK